MRRSGWRFCSSLNLAALRVRRLLGTCDPPGACGVFLPGLHRCAVLFGGYANERPRFARLGQSSPLHEYPTRPRLPFSPLNRSDTVRPRRLALLHCDWLRELSSSALAFWVEQILRFRDVHGVFLKA